MSAASPAPVTAASTPRLGPIVQYALLAGPLLSMVDSSIVNVAVAPIATELHTPLPTVGWTITGYLLAIGTGLAATSFPARRFGTLTVYRASLIGFTLASLACTFAPTIELLVGARVCQGILGAPLVPLAMSMLFGSGDPTRSMSPAAGIMLFLGPALGPSIGGALIGSLGWRAIFAINIPIAAFAVAATWRIPAGLAPGRSVGVRFDPLGLGLLAAGLTLLLYGISGLGTHSWSEPAMWVPGVGGAVLLAVYVWWAGRREYPALDLALVRHGRAVLALLLCAAASVITYTAVFLLPVFLQTAQGYSALATGVAMLPQGIVTGIATVVGQRVLMRVSVRVTVLGGFIVLAVASVALLGIDTHTPIAVTAAILAARAAAIGLVITPLLTVMLAPTRSEELADANTLFNICQRIAGSFGVGAVAVLYATTATHQGPVTALHHTALVLIGLAGLAAIGAAPLPSIRNTSITDR